MDKDEDTTVGMDEVDKVVHTKFFKMVVALLTNHLPICLLFYPHHPPFHLDYAKYITNLVTLLM